MITSMNEVILSSNIEAKFNVKNIKTTNDQFQFQQQEIKISDIFDILVTLYYLSIMTNSD